MPRSQPSRYLSPIHRIPTETLERLLWFAVTSADDYVPSQFHARYNILSAIRRVCRHWNHITLSMLRLWSRVAIDVSSQLSRFPSPQIVQLWLDRTRGATPIEVLIAMPENQPAACTLLVQGIFNVLVPYMNCWGELWFYSEGGVGGFPWDLSAANNLTKLSIDAGVLDEDAIMAIGPSFEKFPGVLRELDLEVVTFDWMVLWGGRYNMRLDELQRLVMRYEGWMQGILNVLSEAQASLTSARIHVDGQWSQSPEYHTFVSGTQGASLSNLRHLRLQIDDANLDIFDFLEMRGLNVLDISVTWSRIPRDARNIAPLINFIEGGMHSLRACTTWCDTLPSNWTTVFFRSPVLSRIQTYQLCNVKVERGTKQTLITSASQNIQNWLSFTRETSPGRFTIGWVDHSI